MVRKVTNKYGVWLCGLYDDFLGAKAIAFDDNEPDNSSLGDYNHFLTHYGNPLNGEATLNPRYRWCVADRAQSASAAYKFAPATMRYFHNKGMFEWLTHDAIRNYPDKWQGRAQLEFPDGHTNSQKYRLGNSGTDGFQMFSNGNDSSCSYIVPNGDIDSSFGRATMKGLGIIVDYANKEGGLSNWVNGSGNDDSINRVRRAHLAGKWMGEQTKQLVENESPQAVFAPVESPSGQPFLIVQAWDKTGSNSIPNKPTLYYNGSLNSRDTGDFLHFRLATRAFNGNGYFTPKITIKAGFPNTGIANQTLNLGAESTSHYEDGLEGTAAISFDVDLTNPFYPTLPKLYNENNTKIAYTNDDFWIDIDVWIDYDNNKFQVYQDGVAKGSLTSFATSRAAKDMFGWEIYTTSPNGIDDAVTYLMLDRMGLYRPLTDSPRDSELNGIYEFSYEAGVNQVSTLKIALEDWAEYSSSYTKGMTTDKYKHQITKIFKEDMLNDWSILFFAGAGETGNTDIARIDRPVWRGLIDNVGLKESINRGRTITINAKDTLSLLSKQVVLWEVGQGKVNDSEGVSPYWAFEAEGMKEIMYLGVSKLKEFAGNVGFEAGNSYKPRDDQRTQLHSGHPIQMYNNEETYGPNDIEDDYEGMGIDYIIHDGTNLFIYLDGNPGYSSSDSITIGGTGNAAYDGKTVDIDGVSVVDGKQRLQIVDGSGSGEMPFTDKKPTDIIYAGKYKGMAIDYEDPEYNWNDFDLTQQESVRRWLNYFMLVMNHPKSQQLTGIDIVNPGGGYHKDLNYYTSIEGVKEHQGDLTVSGGGSGSGFTAAEATWFSDGNEITSVEIRDPGKGYTSLPTVNHAGIQGTGTERRGHILTYTVKATGSNSLATIASSNAVLSMGGSITHELLALNAGGNRISPDCAIFEVTSPDGSLSAGNVTLQWGGYNYDPSGSGTDKITNIMIPRADGQPDYTLEITVNSIAPDATFATTIEGEPTSDFYTFYMKSDPDLLPGDEFVVSGKAVTGHTTTELDKIEGKHVVKSAKKVINYHDQSYNINSQRAVWKVETYTPYADEEFGNWEQSNGLLVTASSPTTIGWSKVTGGTVRPKPASQTEDISNRAIHARWMRDLPQSLWFQYHFGKINYDANPTSCNLDTHGSLAATATEIKIPQATYDAIPSYGLAEIVRVKPSANYELKGEVRDIFIYQCKYEIGSDNYIGGVKYISTDHSSLATGWTDSETEGTIKTTINFLTVNDNYKHLWLLWADMRNDGNANADGGLRKKSFGLQYPSSDNYTVKLVFEDQFDADGGYEIFAELKQGTDVDIWEIDSTLDPITNGPFSQPIDYANAKAFAWTDVSNSGGTVNINHTNHGLTTNDKVALFNINDSSWDGVYDVVATADANNFRTSLTYPGIPSGVTNSNQNDDKFFFAKITGSYADLSTYQNWHEKGGSLLVVDSSRFFNLNTLANDGSFSKTSGGTSNLGDYYAVKEGDPVLIDTYWKQAASTDMTTGSTYSKHENMDRLATLSTELTDVTEGQFWMVPSDLTIFDNEGLGKIIGRKDDEELNTEWFYTWNGKIGTEITGTFENISVTTYDTKWVCTDNQGAFTSDMKGAYIQNTSKPLVAGVGDSWKTNFIQQYWYRIKEVISSTVIHVERVSYLHINPFGGVLNSQPGENYSDYMTGLHGNYLRQVDIDDGWANTHGYKIIKQIFNVNLDTATNVTTDTEYSPKQIEQEFAIRQSEYGARIESHCRVGISNANYLTVTIYNTVAALYAFRLMMHLHGHNENKNIGTFYESDKFRMIWSASLLNSWWTKTKLPMSFGINNIPITTNMTTYNDIASNDTYGSVYRASNKKLSEIIRGIQKGSGSGDTNGLTTTFSYQMGRDNRFEFRNKFNSGYQFTRENVNVTSLDISNSGVISNVRVHYNDGNSFVDYPATNLSDVTKWKIVQHPEVLSDKEALAIAKKEFHKHKANDVSVSLSPIRNTGQGDVMLDGGRYGYIHDPHVALQGNGDHTKGTGWCWTKLGTGGALFPGMVNALDGNIGSQVTTTNKHTRYGSSRIDSVGASSGANTDRDIAANENYYWYGSNSLGHAVQVVNISKDANKVSADTGEQLRVVLALKPNQTVTNINNCQFRLYLLDCGFYNAQHTTGYAPTLKGIIKSKSEKDMKHSGFYEIALPSTYGSGTVTISFNAEYCRDLLRSRCGNPAQTAHGTNNYICDNSIEDIVSASGGSSIELDTGNDTNAHSIFPLGYRHYPEICGGSAHKDGRLLWYAPSLCVVDDIMYVPASYVSYTDAGMDFSAENLVIQQVKWSAVTGRGESVVLKLERDESRSADGLLPYILADPGNYPRTLPPIESAIRPPPGSNETDISSIDDNPSGGNNPGTGSGGSFTNIPSPQNIDNIGRGLTNTIQGIMGLSDSDLTAQSGFHILGQPKSSTTPSWMRGMTGGLRLPVVAGAAISNTNSFELPGIGKEKNGQGEAPTPARDALHAVEIEIQTPSDANTDQFSITGITNIAVGRGGTGNNGVLHITAECLETGARINRSMNVTPAMNQNNIEFISTTLLSGVSSPGNTVRVRVSRTPGVGNDTALYSTISVSNFSINFDRAAFSASSSQNLFIPYR
mgnify:CR=1 FL=1